MEISAVIAIIGCVSLAACCAVWQISIKLDRARRAGEILRDEGKRLRKSLMLAEQKLAAFREQDRIRHEQRIRASRIAAAKRRAQKEAKK